RALDLSLFYGCSFPDVEKLRHRCTAERCHLQNGTLFAFRRTELMAAERRRKIEEQIARHRRAIADLDAELEAIGVVREAHPWPPPGFYFTFYAVVGGILGILGSLASFLFNV